MRAFVKIQQYFGCIFFQNQVKRLRENKNKKSTNTSPNRRANTGDPKIPCHLPEGGAWYGNCMHVMHRANEGKLNARKNIDALWRNALRACREGSRSREQRG